ncbi:MAG TPA: hypothetical protein VLC48_07745 [Gemmatimonadota bacterium]|nr:hypothetical protein [Gemmatimonadota bacterium]
MTRSLAREERGTALFLTLVLLVALVAVSAGAAVMSGTELRLRIYSGAQTDLQYLATMAAEMGLSRVNRDEDALPDTGYNMLEQGFVPSDALGSIIDGYTLDIYAGRSGSATGRSGNFASVVGVARGKGAAAIVRLEVTEESFAKFAYFTDNEGGNIWFAGGDQLLGPVHSNDQIKIHESGATFHAEVTTGRDIVQPGNGEFRKGYEEFAETIAMPDDTDMSRLEALARAGNTSFATPSTGTAADVEMRIEFLAIDVNGEGDDTDDDEGFFRVYRSISHDWLAAKGTETWTENCGDVHSHPLTGRPTFISARNHRQLFLGDGYAGRYGVDVAAWKDRAELRHGVGGADWTSVFEEAAANVTSRCYLGGDPRLEMDGRSLNQWSGSSSDDGWLRREDVTEGMSLPVTLTSRDDADFLFPLSREYNPEFRGVLFFDGLIGVSGVLNGRVTIVSSDNIVLLDDFTYSVPANADKCNDIAGFLTANNFYVSDNYLNAPQKFSGVGGPFRTYDETASEFIDGIILALNTSFTVENFRSGPQGAESCEGRPNGRGCLYLTGGLIQDTRGAVGLTSGEGYIKRYAYDSNARFCPPPHYPTTGRYSKNRYYEVNPGAFEDLGAFFAELR